MKRRMLLLIAAAVLLSTAAGVCGSNGNVIHPILQFPNIDQYDKVQYEKFGLFQGWENNQLAWFVATDASDHQIACEILGVKTFDDGLNFAPRLSSLAGQVATAYVVVNPKQGLVFSALPGDPTYSGIWQVIAIEYKPGAIKHFVTNTDPYDAVTNPTGLPPVSDAEYITLNRAGNPFVMKLPIVATGQLGGPWDHRTDVYRIPQGKVDRKDYYYGKYKFIYLPFWNAYCRNPITKKVCVRRFAVPDALDPVLAGKIGANVAPGLGLIDLADTQAFYLQFGPQAVTQYPVFHACPTEGVFNSGGTCDNFNYDYTPVEQIFMLQRVAPLSPSTIINNEPLIQTYLGNGRLVPIVGPPSVINATILPEELAEIVRP